MKRFSTCAGLTLSVLFLVSSAIGLASCSKASARKEKPLIVVSILPQSYFVERIAGDRVEVLTLVGPGQDPHSYEPTPQQISELGKASLWCTIGVDFENALKPKISSLCPSLPIVDTVAKVHFRNLETRQQEGETHEAEGGRDPHVWLGHASSLAQAEEIRDALIEIDPSGASIYKKNFDALASDVDSVFAELTKDLSTLRGKTVFVFHPAFGYFFDEFGIEQVAVETGGKEPTQKGLVELSERARKAGTKAIFVQAQFPVSSAKVLASSIGGAVVPLDPLAQDWLDNLRRIGEGLKKAL